MSRYGLILIAIIFASVIMQGCGGVAKIVGVSAKLGKEIDSLSQMEREEVVGKVDKTIDIERLKSDPDGILGQYVQLTGKINLEGSKDFPMTDMHKKGRSNKEGGAFLFEDVAFVISIDPIAGLKTGDEIELLGFVSESRFLKEIAEMYPKEKMPSLVTIIAKEVKKIESTS